MRLIRLIPVLALTGCSLIPNPGEPTKKFVLGSLPPQNITRARSPQIIVDVPSVYPPLDNQRVALTPKGQIIDYYADVEWADRLAVLVQDSVVYSLQNTPAFKSTSRNSDGIIPEYSIKIDVRQFWVDQASTPAKAVVEYFVQIIRMSDREVIAAKSSVGVYPITNLEITGIVHGLNQSHRQALQDLVTFVDRTI
jgi:cholesterol transport system auxiliary component